MASSHLGETADADPGAITVACSHKAVSQAREGSANGIQILTGGTRTKRLICDCNKRSIEVIGEPCFACAFVGNERAQIRPPLGGREHGPLQLIYGFKRRPKCDGITASDSQPRHFPQEGPAEDDILQLTSVELTL